MSLSKVFTAKGIFLAALVAFGIASEVQQAEAQPVFSGPYSQLTLNVLFTNAVGVAPVSVNDVGTIDLYSPVGVTNSSPWPHQFENLEVVAHLYFGSVDTIVPFAVYGVTGSSQDGWSAGTVDSGGFVTIDLLSYSNPFVSGSITYESTASDLTAHFSDFQSIGWLVGEPDPDTMEASFVANFVVTSAFYIPDVTSVPEPSVFSFGITGVGLLFWSRRTSCRTRIKLA